MTIIKIYRQITYNKDIIKLHFGTKTVRRECVCLISKADSIAIKRGNDKLSVRDQAKYLTFKEYLSLVIWH